LKASIIYVVYVIDIVALNDEPLLSNEKAEVDLDSSLPMFHLLGVAGIRWQ